MFLKFKLFILILLYSYIFIPIHYINPQLKSITDEIFNTVNLYCKHNQYYIPKNTLVYFKKLKEPIVGQCGLGFHQYSIVLDTTYWNYYNDDYKYQLLVHEYSHCILFKKHVSDETNYMFPSMVKLTKEQVKEQFVRDLKEHCEKKVLIYQ